MMQQLRRAASAALLTLVMAACSDAAGPVGPNLELTSTDLAARKPGDTTTVPVLYALRHAAGAPSLSSYQVSFWAVRGQDRSVTVRYGTNGPQYLQFTVPRLALDKGPDGRRLAMGDSVLVSLTLDPVEFRVDFAPSGLQFSTRGLPTLRTWYGYMDPDVDRDGDVDATDQAIVQSGMTYYHYDLGGVNWRKVTSVLDPVAKVIETTVGGFSGYAVSW